jgi:hypothetical protein
VVAPQALQAIDLKDKIVVGDAEQTKFASHRTGYFGVDRTGRW